METIARIKVKVPREALERLGTSKYNVAYFEQSIKETVEQELERAFKRITNIHEDIKLEFSEWVELLLVETGVNKEPPITFFGTMSKGMDLLLLETAWVALSNKESFEQLAGHSDVAEWKLLKLKDALQEYFKQEANKVKEGEDHGREKTEAGGEDEGIE